MMILQLFLATAPALFTWHGHASKVTINTVNGNVTVTRSADDEIHMTAQGVNVDADEHVRVVPDRHGVVICEVYRSADSPDARCPASGAMLGVPGRPQRVDFAISLPKGVDQIRIATVNGAVSASLESPAVIETVNGGVEVESDVSARLTTVNGAIKLTMTAERWPGPASVTSINGDVAIGLTADVDTAIDAESASRVFRAGRQPQLHLVRGHGRSSLTIHATSGAIVIREGATIVAQTE